MPRIYLYAEVLTHLRQLTLHVSLETEKNEETKIDISSDKKIITVIHDGESASLYLPTQISGTAKVTFPYDRKTEISARVQIDDLEQWKETDAAGIEAPWNASELTSETVMRCAKCETEILPTKTISSWKDLPNQHWAEVMDLWFCHKPHEHDDGEQEQRAAEAKGFSAHSRISSEPGIGLVDLVSFALHPDDCKFSKISKTENENSFKPVPVQCPACHLLIGMFSTNDNLVRLDKSSLCIKSARDQPFTSYPPSTFISAQLLELVESTAMRKVLVFDQSTETATMASVTTGAEEDEDAENSDGHTDLPMRGTKAAAAEEVTTNAVPSAENMSKTTSDLSSNSTPTAAAQQDQSPKPQPEPQALLLWIFNPDIYYSSSRLTTSTSPSNITSKSSKTPPTSYGEKSSDSKTDTSPSSAAENTNTSTPTQTNTTTLLPHRAQKIFYQPIPPQTLPSLLSSSSSSSQHEPLPLPAHSLTNLHETLQASTSMLPSNARTFQGVWSVGLLDRWERRGTAERVMEMNPLARRLVSAERGDLGMDGRGRVTRWELPAGAAELFL